MKLNGEKSKTLKRFVIVGSFVFLIDYFLYEIYAAFFNTAISRFFSYSCSTWIAWRLNSKYTFSSKSGTFINYYLGALTAGVQNILISNWLEFFFGGGYLKTFLFIAIGSIYGLFFNFTFQRRITFK